MVVAQFKILFQNCVEKQRKPQRTSVTTVSILTEIRIVELLATLQKRYSLTQHNTADPNDPMLHEMKFINLFTVIRVEILKKKK